MLVHHHFILIATVLFAFTLLSALIGVPQLIRYFKEKNFMDVPDERKKHKAPIPSSGGLIFGITAVLSSPFLLDNPVMFIPFVCSLGLMAVGFADDRYNLSAKIKFGFQIVAAIAILAVMGPVNVFGSGYEVWNYAVCFFFIVGFTNAFNLIDGVDGLAGTTGLFMLLILSVLFIIGNDFTSVLYIVGLVAGLAGFLRYNLYKASIFMGDTGSLFIGFTISYLALLAAKNQTVAVHFGSSVQVVLPILLALLMLPMLDTIRVMGGRILRKKSPFKADRSHLHHLLLKIGLTSVKIVLFFIGFTILLLAQAMFLVQFDWNVVLIVVSLVITANMIFNALIYIRMKHHARRINEYQKSLNYLKKKNHLLSRNEYKLLKHAAYEKDIYS